MQTTEMVEMEAGYFMDDKVVIKTSEAIPFYTPNIVSPAEYKMKIKVNGNTFNGTSCIKWTHRDNKPLQTLYIQGEYTNLEITSHEDCKIDRDKNVTLIMLNKPLSINESVAINIDFCGDMVTSPFCDGDGSVIMPKNYDDSWPPWYPVLTWDMPVCGHYHLEVDEPKGYRICATGRRDGNTYTQDFVRVFGLLFCKGLEYIEQAVGDVTVKAFFKQSDQIAAGRLMDTSVDAIQFFQELMGFYPQHSYSFLPYSSKWMGGGNWSTGIAFFHSMDSYNEAECGEKLWIAAHEICHHYFMEYIPDGDYCGWLEIGLGMVMDEEYSISRGIANRGLGKVKSSAGSVIKYHQDGNDTTIWRTIEAFNHANKSGNDYQSIIRHDKAFCVMQMLKQVIGKEALLDAMKRILNEYAGKALRTMDFWRICEEISGMRLDWFFTDLLYSNRLAGYKITSIEGIDEGTSVTVESFGDYKFPVCIDARLPDGSILRQQLNRLMCKQVIFFDAKPEDIEVWINTDGQLLIQTYDAINVYGGDC